MSNGTMNKFYVCMSQYIGITATVHLMIRWMFKWIGIQTHRMKTVAVLLEKFLRLILWSWWFWYNIFNEFIKCIPSESHAFHCIQCNYLNYFDRKLADNLNHSLHSSIIIVRYDTEFLSIHTNTERHSHTHEHLG